MRSIFISNARYALVALAVSVSAAAAAQEEHEWTLLMQMTYYRDVIETIRITENRGPQTNTYPGYSGSSSQEQKCEGSATEDPDWTPRVAQIYGPLDVVIDWNKSDYEVPSMYCYRHWVEWSEDVYGEMWTRDDWESVNYDTNGDGIISAQEVTDAMTPPDATMAARLDTRWTAIQDWKTEPIATTGGTEGGDPGTQ